MSRAGLSALYFVPTLLIVLIFFVSLAVDVGRMRLARTQVQVATDAAARAGANSLPHYNIQGVIDNTTETALANGVIDRERQLEEHLGERTNPGLELIPDADIEVGRWDDNAHTFTPIEDDDATVRDERRGANAVHVMGRRTAERGNAIPLIFAPSVGVFTADASSSAIAFTKDFYDQPGQPDAFAFVGIDTITGGANGSAFDSVQLPSTSRRPNTVIASDGDIHLNATDVYGAARPGMGRKLFADSAANVTGWTAPLEYRLARRFRAVSGPPSGAMPIPPHGIFSGGSDPANQTVYAGELPAEFTVSGYVRIYVTDAPNSRIDLAATKITWANGAPDPEKLEIYVTGSNITGVTAEADVKVYAHLYAPQANLLVGGKVDFYGWAIARQITIVGVAGLHYDESKSANELHHILLER
jgi:Flp pilus assembly protein TadG